MSKERHPYINMVGFSSKLMTALHESIRETDDFPEICTHTQLHILIEDFCDGVETILENMHAPKVAE